MKIAQGGGTKVLDFARSAGLDLLALMAEHAQVRDDTLRNWLAVHEMRAAVAADAARLCALRASSELKAAVLSVACKMRDLGDGAEVFTLEVRFWDLVIEGAANIAYRLAFNTLLKSVFTPEIAGLAQQWSLHEVKQSGYRVPIAQAIAAADADMAESLTRTSLRGVVDVLAQQVLPGQHQVARRQRKAGSKKQ